MKWFSVLALTSLAATASAQCEKFRFRVGNSPNAELNGMYLQSYNNTATIGLDFSDLIAYFPDPNVTQGSELFASGLEGGDGIGNFMLIPVDNSEVPVEILVFNDFGAGQVRYTDWWIHHGFASSILSYGEDWDKFMAFPTGNEAAPWTILWVPAGTVTLDVGFDIDFIQECI